MKEQGKQTLQIDPRRKAVSAESSVGYEELDKMILNEDLEKTVQQIEVMIKDKTSRKKNKRFWNRNAKSLLKLQKQLQAIRRERARKKKEQQKRKEREIKIDGITPEQEKAVANKREDIEKQSTSDASAGIRRSKRIKDAQLKRLNTQQRPSKEVLRAMQLIGAIGQRYTSQWGRKYYFIVESIQFQPNSNKRKVQNMVVSYPPQDGQLNGWDWEHLNLSQIHRNVTAFKTAYTKGEVKDTVYKRLLDQKERVINGEWKHERLIPTRASLENEEKDNDDTSVSLTQNADNQIAAFITNAALLAKKLKETQPKDDDDMMENPYTMDEINKAAKSVINDDGPPMTRNKAMCNCPACIALRTVNLLNKLDTNIDDQEIPTKMQSNQVKPTSTSTLPTVATTHKCRLCSNDCPCNAPEKAGIAIETTITHEDEATIKEVMNNVSKEEGKDANSFSTNSKADMEILNIIYEMAKDAATPRESIEYTHTGTADVLKCPFKHQKKWLTGEKREDKNFWDKTVLKLMDRRLVPRRQRLLRIFRRYKFKKHEKVDANGVDKRFKVRNVGDGSYQNYTWEHTTSSVVRQSTVRLIVATGSYYGMTCIGADVASAFLSNELGLDSDGNKEVYYAILPKRFRWHFDKDPMTACRWTRKR